MVGLVDLARRAPEMASARQLAQSSQVPLPMLMNILKELVAGGLVSSTRGVNGGYRLTRNPDEITLSELIQAIEGPINLTVCCNSTPGTEQQLCDLERRCPTRAPMRKVNDVFRQFLNGVTLAHLLSDQVPISVGLADDVQRGRRQAAMMPG